MEPPEEFSRSRYLKVAISLMIVAAIVALFASGVYRQFELEALREAILDAGPLGSLAFLVAFTVLQPLNVSSHVFIIGAALIWSPPVAFALSFVGSMTASHLAFGTARWLGRDYVQPRLPERMRRYDERLSNAGLRAVIWMKVLLFNMPALQFALGVSRMPLRTFSLGTAIGNLPTILVDIAIGVFIAQQ
ncbi:MAG: TVP38/TMEM64 family protein [Polyangiaceae bacterium]|nr:TVP38/TMEM64 family protein [Polyangiaceae bacterium]